MIANHYVFLITALVIYQFMTSHSAPLAWSCLLYGSRKIVDTTSVMSPKRPVWQRLGVGISYSMGWILWTWKKWKAIIIFSYIYYVDKAHHAMYEWSVWIFFALAILSLSLGAFYSPRFARQNWHETSIVKCDWDVEELERSAVEFPREAVGVVGDTRRQSIHGNRRIIHEKHHVPTNRIWCNTIEVRTICQWTIAMRKSPPVDGNVCSIAKYTWRVPRRNRSNEQTPIWTGRRNNWWDTLREATCTSRWQNHIHPPTWERKVTRDRGPSWNFVRCSRQRRKVHVPREKGTTDRLTDGLSDLPYDVR